MVRLEACIARRLLAGAATLAVLFIPVGCGGSAQPATASPTSSAPIDQSPSTDTTDTARETTTTTAIAVAQGTDSDSEPPLASDHEATTVPVRSSGGQADYEALLAQLDVAVDGAPPQAVQLGGATLCGWDRLGGPSIPGDKIDAGGRECFVAAHRAGAPAVFVDLVRDNEGATVPIILRTQDGHTTMYRDWTKSLSSDDWQTESCATLYVGEVAELAAPTAPLIFSCTQLEGMIPA